MLFDACSKSSFYENSSLQSCCQMVFKKEDSSIKYLQLQYHVIINRTALFLAGAFLKSFFFIYMCNLDNEVKILN